MPPRFQSKINSKDYFKEALDDMEERFNGPESTFDNRMYDRFLKCFNKFNSTLLFDSQVAAWKGIADYWDTNPQNVDYNGNPDPWRKGWKFYESTSRPDAFFMKNNVQVMEPCNYVSVITYYHSIIKLCEYGDEWSVDPVIQDDTMKALAGIAVGSAFMHASFTSVGDKLDNHMIGVTAYLGYQISMMNMPNKSLLLEGLQWQEREKNITLVLDNLTRTIQNEPVMEWARVLDHEDYPRDYFVSFSAIVVNLFAFCTPGYVTKPVITFLAETLLRNHEAEKNWLLNDYMPEILRAIGTNPIPLKERVGLGLKVAGVLMKLIHAFLYQEEHVPVPGFLGLLLIAVVCTYLWLFSRMKKCRQQKPRFSHQGILIRCTLLVFVYYYATILLIPFFNQFADLLTGFKQPSPELTWSTNLYPGHAECKFDQSHSIWHELSANGLVDLLYLCDHINKLVIAYIAV